MKASVGRIVWYFNRALPNHGPHPAVVVQVHGSGAYVDLEVFGPVFESPFGKNLRFPKAVEYTPPEGAAGMVEWWEWPPRT